MSQRIEESSFNQTLKDLQVQLAAARQLPTSKAQTEALIAISTELFKISADAHETSSKVQVDFFKRYQAA